MAKYSAVKATVNAYIKQNGRKEITGRILNAVLNATIDSLGKYFQFAGGALPTDDPGTPDQNVCYLAGEPGVYTNFGGITIENEEVALLFWDGEWTKQRILIGIQEVEAEVDNQTGTPSVDVSYSGGRLVLTFHNLKGDKGNTGDAAGFGTIGADIAGGVGTPGVSVETSGSNTAKNIMFHFTNLKGETGVTSVVATIDDTSGTPSCQVSLVGQQLTLAFSGLKGLKGDTGVSADYPITIYNGLDSDATDQALSAAQGKVLDGKVSQLGQEVAQNNRIIIGTSDFAGNAISSLQAYAAGSTAIRSTTANYWLYLYKIPAYSYYTINRGSAPADTFAIVGLIDSPQSFVIGGNLSKVLLWGSDASGVDHTYFTEEETYLVVLGNSSKEKRYATTELTTTKSISDKINETETTLSANIDAVNNEAAFLDEGKELRENLSFIRAFYHATNGVRPSTTRVLSRKIEGKEGLLTISTAKAASDLRVIWVRLLNGQTDAISNWLTDKHLNIHLLEGYDYYIQIAKTDDSAITLDDITAVEIYFNKGDIISCNKDAIPNLSNMRRPKHNYSSSGTYQPCLSIAYFSDVHANANNIRRIIEFVGKYGNFVDDVLQTGDLIAGDLAGGIPSNWATLGKNVLGVIGNHDAQNKVNGVWVTQPAIDSYNAVFASFISNWGVTQPDGAATNGYCYWYKDYSGQKVRLIALDCMHWNATQKTWFETTLASAKTANYSVIVAVHYLPFQMQHTETAFDSIDFTPTPSVGDFFASQEIPDAVADFMTSGGKFICYLTGHVHIDLCGIGVSYPNQFCISVACASADNTATIYGDTERVRGSKSEDCLNIVAFDTLSKTIKITRIGVDHDRYMRTKDFVSFNYETKEVIS